MDWLGFYLVMMGVVIYVVLQFACAIVGFVYLAQRPKLRRMSAAQFPDVPPVEFAKWQWLELRSIGCFLWAAWGPVVLGIPLFLVSRTQTFTEAQIGLGESGSWWPLAVLPMVAAVSVPSMFVIGLVLSLISGIEAGRLKKKLGISLRRKP